MSGVSGFRRGTSHDMKVSYLPTIHDRHYRAIVVVNRVGFETLNLQ